MKEVKNEENSPMYLTGFDLEKVAQFCSLFKKSSPSVCVCGCACVCYLLYSAVTPSFL